MQPSAGRTSAIPAVVDGYSDARGREALTQEIRETNAPVRHSRAKQLSLASPHVSRPSSSQPLRDFSRFACSFRIFHRWTRIYFAVVSSTRRTQIEKFTRTAFLQHSLLVPVSGQITVAIKSTLSLQFQNRRTK